MVGGCETEGAVVSFREAEEATGSGGGGGGGGGEDEGGGKSSEDKIGGGGNRWPQEETMALLKIRSDMDLVFRKATLKAPLWEQVSRKLGEVGFHRTPKKCKEKFENVYKYHRRTKDGRCRRQTGKAYKFFQQLEALDCVSPPLDATPLPLSPPAATTPSAADHMGNPMIHPIAAYRVRNNNNAAPGGHLHHQDTTVTSRSRSTEDTHDDAHFAFTPAASLSTDAEDTTTLSSSLSGGEKKDPGQGRRRRKRKRKLEALFNRLMKEVVAKQEDLQRQFMDAIDKCETQRRAREEVWKAQELAKLKREQDILAQERAISAAKDAAVMAFLHKMSSSSSHNSFPSELLEPQTQSPPPPEERGGAGQKPSAEMTPTTTMAAAAATPTSQNNNNNNIIIVIDKKENAGGSNSLMFPAAAAAANNNQIQIQTSPLIMSASAPNSSPRWPKAEVDALIRMRTDMEQRYLENGPKGLLWEEISLKMKRLGYHRSSKKCKEKWENINKYFRRVKDTKRKRGEDAKTCPYFHQLDALYREKDAAAAATVTATCNNNNTAVTVATTSSSSTTTTPLHPASNNPGPHLKPEELLMQMMAQDRPHQMVRPASASAHAQEQNANNDDINEGEMSGGDQDDEVAEDDDADFDDEAQEEEEDGDAYQIVANNNSSSMPVMRC